ncbi:hypothetical protein D1159_03625 [Pseudoflavonifractor sp. 524-17]|uniref:DUF6551 family protein n=1 Tax=Pseudoflavonifractor sp. 524-17 TaxID=2304577 RepID=UPI0013795482|nr:DUF6551 family protein [Pseudoflavonifractor sp. 524-17]NCE63689.1 hypothetical protein [Pseudoflavonifractor sp. 524-17]
MAPKIDYVLLDINTKDIYIDELGQRDVNRRRAQFNTIMRTFDENLVQPVSVAFIDGKYYCFDGQMTMKVLKARNGGRDLCVKCRVYNGMTKLDAAKMFIRQRGTTSRINLADQIRVNGNYGDQASIDFQRLTEENGLEISWTGSKAKNSVVAVSTLWSEFNAFADNEMYSSYIRVIKQAWDGDPSGSQAAILKGLGLFMRTYKGKAKEDILIAKLNKKRPNDIVRDAQADRTSGPRKYAVQILQAYNFSAREKDRLPNLL